MSRDHDAPLEYLRILASLKLRFGLAALATAHGALPVCSPMVALVVKLSQWFRGSSSFPMNVTGRQAEVHSGSASITRQSARRFVSLIAGLTHHTQTGGDIRGADPSTDRYLARSTALAIFRKVANSPKHDGPLSSFPPRGTGGLRRRLTLFTGADPGSDLVQTVGIHAQL